MAMTLSTEDKLEYHFFPVTSGQIQFRIKAPNDAHLALTSGPQEGDPMYEVFIGGWGNTKSVIRKNRTKPDVAEVATPSILSKDEFRGFWIRWDDGVINVGKEGEQSSFLTYTDTELIGIGYFGVCTGWGASGEWMIEGQPVLKTRDILEYKFYPVRAGGILFEVKAKSNAHLAFTSAKKETSPMYMVILGGWENTASVIRYDNKKPDKVRIKSPNILDEREYISFSITWLDGNIVIKEGNQRGRTIMEWEDPNPIGISFVGLRTGWGATGLWKFRFEQNWSYPSLGIAPRMD